MLCTVLLVQQESIGTVLLLLLIAYNVWAAYVLWAESRGRPVGRTQMHYWVDVGWTLMAVHLSDSSRLLMALTLVQPIALASIGYGVSRGVALALFAAGGMLLDFDAALSGRFTVGSIPLSIGLSILALGPTVALLARPMTTLRERNELVRLLEAHIDPRRGLDELARSLVVNLQASTAASVAGLVLPTTSRAPAFLANAAEGAVRLGTGMHPRFDTLLAQLPACAITHVVSRWKFLPGQTRAQSNGDVAGAELRGAMDELAKLLQVRALTVVPLLRYGRVHGHVLLGADNAGMRFRQFQALADAASEVQHLVEQAALVDQLQEEFAAYERVRIGRDLHDSAIQPYLGLKYAVEGVALRVSQDNPVRADLDGLVELVNTEVNELREAVFGLRSGEPRGDNALVPSVRRQARRFARLFGIDVDVDLPEELLTSRTLAGAIFHMVNEAMNNARKHTPAQRINVNLRSDNYDIVLRVQDDAGARLGRPLPDFFPTSLAERATELGGTLKINRRDGLNTEVVITVPQYRSTAIGR